MYGLIFWQFDSKCTAAAVGVADGEPAAVCMADFPGYGEAQSEMSFVAVGRIDLVEPAEYFFFFRIRDAFSGICHLDIVFSVGVKQI